MRQLSNSWGNSYVQFLVIGYSRSLSELTLTLKEETYIIFRKITLPPMILKKFAFSFAFDLRKQNVADFSFIYLTQTLSCALKLLLSGIVSFSTWYQCGLSDNGCSSVPLASVLSPPWCIAPPNNHIQKLVIPECIGKEILF